MTVKTIQTSNFRNLKDFQSVELDNKINVIYGKNGSGKTSFLEALFTLNTGRSFRTQKLESIIAHSDEQAKVSADAFIVFGKLNSRSPSSRSDVSDQAIGDLGEEVGLTSVGIQKSKTEKTSIKINGEPISNASSLAALMPTLLLEPNNTSLLLQSSQARRKFIDWGVFHVEHLFNSHWKNFNQCLKQRNAILKQLKHTSPGSNHYLIESLEAWEAQASQFGEAINTMRINYFEVFLENLLSEVSGFEELSLSALKLSYRSGWDKNLSLAEALRNSRDKDIEKGYTSVGPHRMDVRIRNGSLMAGETLSRGQQKILIIAMYITQVRALQSLSNKVPLVLIDDIEAELDESNAIKVFERLVNMPTQLVSTCLDPTRIKRYLDQQRRYNMFHVEHGTVSRID